MNRSLQALNQEIVDLRARTNRRLDEIADRVVDAKVEFVPDEGEIKKLVEQYVTESLGNLVRNIVRDEITNLPAQTFSDGNGGTVALICKPKE